MCHLFMIVEQIILDVVEMLLLVLGVLLFGQACIFQIMILTLFKEKILMQMWPFYLPKKIKHIGEYRFLALKYQI
ncbi:hypothetical protein ES703_96793 [subsurface metagenome]